MENKSGQRVWLARRVLPCRRHGSLRWTGSRWRRWCAKNRGMHF